MVLSVEEATSDGNDIPSEEEIEQMLSEKLMEGYTLLESCCPVCTTPLIKNAVKGNEDGNKTAQVKHPVLLSSDSFEKPFKPVDGVPICVVCQAHVVTSESDISILERCESLKDKGSILMALNESSSDVEESYEEEDEDDDNVVVISVESMEKDGEENIFEVSSTPKSGDPRAPIFVEEDHDEDEVSDVMTEYSVR